MEKLRKCHSDFSRRVDFALDRATGVFPTPVKERLQQLYILLVKDFRLALRSYKTSLVQILAPLFFLFILILIQSIPHNAYYADGNPPPTTIGKIPKCIVRYF